MKCLVIIDMQWYFDAARESWLILNIVDKVKRYIERNEPIIILEYVDDNCDESLGRSVPEILDAVDEYKNCFIAGKMENDGGEQIGCIMYEQDFNIQEFEVCGVNLDACIMDTVVSMSWDYPNIPINVVIDCCNSNTDQKGAEADFEYEMEICDRLNVALVAN